MFTPPTSSRSKVSKFVKGYLPNGYEWPGSGGECGRGTGLPGPGPASRMTLEPLEESFTFWWSWIMPGAAKSSGKPSPTQECIGNRWMTRKWGRFIYLSNLYKFCSSFLFTLVFPKQIFTYIPTHRLTEGKQKNPCQFPYFLWTGGYCNKPVPLDFHLLNDVPLPFSSTPSIYPSLPYHADT